MTLSEIWASLARRGASWETMQGMECQECQQERGRRNRLIESKDARLQKEPFLSGPFVHQNNEPKYHALLLRAVEHAKRSAAVAAHILWVVAQDAPTGAEATRMQSLTELEKKRAR